MSNAYHAADDGSLARSTGGAAARGAMLIAVALVIGLLLMAFALDDPATEVVASSADTTQTDDTVDDGTAEPDATTETDPTVADQETGVEAVDPDPTADEVPATIPPVDDVVVDPPAGTLLPSNEVNVLVANGTGGAGVAGGIADQLIADGYTAQVSNAPATAAAVIFYRAGFDANALAIAEILGAAPDIVSLVPADGSISVSAEAINDGRLDQANIIVIAGTDNAIPVG